MSSSSICRVRLDGASAAPAVTEPDTVTSLWVTDLPLMMTSGASESILSSTAVMVTDPALFIAFAANISVVFELSV